MTEQIKKSEINIYIGFDIEILISKISIIHVVLTVMNNIA